MLSQVCARMLNNHQYIKLNFSDHIIDYQLTLLPYITALTYTKFQIL